MYTTPHNRNVNTNSKGLILDNMTWSATQFNVPMVTAGFLTALLKTMWQVWLYTCPHTHTHKSTLHLQKGRGGEGAPLLFSLFSWIFHSEQACTHKQEHTHTAKGTDTARIIRWCVDPHSCENLRSVSPPPSHVLLLSALIPSLCRCTWLEGRSSGAPLHWAEAEFGVQERVVGKYESVVSEGWRTRGHYWGGGAIYFSW